MTKKTTGRPTGSFGETGKAKLEKLETSHEILSGASITLLSALFRMDSRTVRIKIGNVKACGVRRGAPVWHIREVAPFLVKPAGDIEEHIKRMRPNDLPPILSKEYWNGQRAKQRYLEDEGDLWRTDKVVDAFATVFKVVRMGLLLIPDSLERKTSLTDIQREEIQLAIDETLAALRDELVKIFGDDDSVEPGLGDDHTPTGQYAPPSAEEPAGGDEEDDTFYVPESEAADDDDHGL